MTSRVNYLALLIFTIIGCNSQTAVNEGCYAYESFNNLIGIPNREKGIDDKLNTNSDLLQLLDNSEDIEFQNRFNAEYNLEWFVYNGFKILRPKSNSNNTWLPYYLSYRYAEYIEDIDKNTLMAILTDGYSYVTQADSVSNNCIKKAFEIEFEYLSAYSNEDGSIIREKVERFIGLIKLYPSSSRVKYLWARLNYDLDSSHTSHTAFQNLFNAKYYMKPILRRFIRHYVNLNDDSVRKYSTLMNNLYPNDCNLGKITLILDSKNNDSEIINACQQCFSGLSQKDSLLAKVLLCKYYLVTKRYLIVNKMYQDYKINNKKIILDSIKIWETGEYYDLLLRSYFLQKKYLDIYEFIIKELGYNKKIIIHDEKDYYNLILKYYQEYINKTPLQDEFNQFYKNTKPIKSVFQFSS